MEQPNKAVISEGLNGLMLVQRGLEALQKQGAGAPTMGGLPTIADQARQAGEQALAPQQAQQQQQQQPNMMPPPQGARAPEGGIAGIAQNAATGMGIKQMQDQQAQKAVMQMAMQQQQQAPQMMASGGIAGLHAENMRGFAEGGVLGFAGDEEQGSEVPSLEERVRGQAVKEALLRSGRVQQPQPKVSLEGMFNAMRRLRGLQPTGAPVLTDHSRQELQGGIAAPAAPASTAAPAPAPARPAPARSPTVPAAVDHRRQDLQQMGMASLVAPASAPASTPATAESPEVAAILANEARKQALNKARPDFYAQNIAALDADKLARAEAAVQQQKREGFEGLMAMFAGGSRGPGGMGEASTAFNRGIVAQRDAARQATLLDAQMRVKLGELEHARQIGDIDGQSSVMKDIAAIKRQMETVAVQRSGVDAQMAAVDASLKGQTSIATTAANKLAQDLITGREGLASQERVAALQREAAGNKRELSLFLKEINDAQIDKRYDKIVAFEPLANTPESKRKLVEMKTAANAARDEILKKYPSLTKNDIPANLRGGADAPAAEPKADAKWGTMKVDGK